MGNLINNQPSTKVIANGVYVVKDGDTQWGGVANKNFEILSELNKRAKLYITYGDVEEDTMPVKNWSYSVDGNDVLIQLPKQSVPKADHFKLTIKMDGTTMGIFDNTQDQTIDIYSPTYADLVFKQNGNILQTYRPDGNSIDITIPEVTSHILTITQNNNVIGTFNTLTDATIDIPSVIVSNKTLTFMYGNQVLGTFDNTSNQTITIPTISSTFVPKTLTMTYNGQTLGTFTTDNDNTIDLSTVTSFVPKTLTITSNGQTLGTFNTDNDSTIDIPVSTASFNGATHDIVRYSGFTDSNGVKQFTSLQSLNTARVEEIKTYDLVIDYNGNLISYNPFVDDTYSLVINTNVGLLKDSDVSDSITFSPYPKQYDETFYIKDLVNNNKSGTMTVDLPVHYVDVWDGNPKDAQGNVIPTTNLLCHFSTYGSDGTDMIFNMSPYMKVADMPTKVSEFSNDAGYLTATDITAMLSSLGVPKNLSDLNNDMDVSEFNNDAGYITETYADGRYLKISDYQGSGGSPVTGNFITEAYADSKYLTINSADSRYAKPSDIPTKLSDLNNDMVVSDFVNDANYLTEAAADGKYLTITDAGQTYLKISDLPTDLSQFNVDLDLGDFTNNAGYLKEAVADVKYVMAANMPTDLSQFNNDLSLSSFTRDLQVSDFVNDADYISESRADGKYVPLSSVNVPNGVAALNADGHLVLPSGIEIW